MDKLWFLQNDDFFIDLVEEKEEFLKLSTKKTFKRNEIIFLEENETRGCYYIVNGLVRMFNSSQLGRETVFFMHQKGNMFGLSEVLERKVRQGTAQALIETETYFIEHDTFERFLQKHFNVAKRTISVLGARVRKLSVAYALLASRPVPERFIYLLLALSYNNIKNKEDWYRPTQLPYKLSQEQIATMIASTQPTVSLLIKELVDEGILQSVRQPITIVNPSKLYAKYNEIIEAR